MADVTDDPPEERKTKQELADELLAQVNRPMEYASTRNDDKLKELEERIRQLEARPWPIVQPYPVPTWPGINPPLPWYDPYRWGRVFC